MRFNIRRLVHGANAIRHGVSGLVRSATGSGVAQKPEPKPKAVKPEKIYKAKLVKSKSLKSQKQKSVKPQGRTTPASQIRVKPRNITP